VRGKKWQKTSCRIISKTGSLSFLFYFLFLLTFRKFIERPKRWTVLDGVLCIHLFIFIFFSFSPFLSSPPQILRFPCMPGSFVYYLADFLRSPRGWFFPNF
jgi:hypothetical protein